ncbi:MAG: serine protein kinase [Gemmatimonadetes bacterium]|nr:serine protein kinase [Gemmatimonadota bacterium]
MSTPVLDIIQHIREHQDQALYHDLHWEGSFPEYLSMVHARPAIARSAFQRLYAMIVTFGTRKYSEYKKEITHYHFFDDPIGGGKDAIFGLDVPLMRFIQVLKAAGMGYGPERRVLLLHGPVGSSKSTICRLLKKGIEYYSRTPDGALYTFSWVGEGLAALGVPAEMAEAARGTDEMPCPMHEEPLKLIPQEFRAAFLDEPNRDMPDEGKIAVEGDFCPACRHLYNQLMLKYDGDWTRTIEHVRVRRLLVSEQDRVGIGTFQPKDEKNQDSTELTGDINYRKIAIYGSDSDPRAFNFDGEFNVANRGLIEFVEVLKLDVAFLYDLLGASQEHRIKPKKFAQTDVDEVIIAHTNEPEYRRLQNNEFMEALRDRTVKIDIPYITKLDEEIKVYERDFNNRRIKGKHMAPHTIEMASMWAVLTRLEEPKKLNLTRLQKLKLYNGKTLPGFTEDNVKELRKEAEREGMEGVSPRYIQDKLSNCLVAEVEETCVNPFMVLKELESGLKHHSLIVNAEQREKYRELLAVVREEYEDMVKNEVQRAISGDEEAMQRLCANYIDNVKAYTQREKVRNKYTGEYEEPDERLMRSIEEKIDIPESRKDDFRREIMNYIGALAVDGKKFRYDTNARLQKALELKLFEDQQDSIKLTSLVSSVLDREAQEKIDVVKSRLVHQHGYCEVCATDVLNFVASIFARGDVKEGRK